MNILVVSQHYYPEQFRVTDICESLVSEGHKVTVLTGLPNYPKGKIYPGYGWFKKTKEVVNGVEVIRSPIIPRGNATIQLMINYVSFALVASIKVLLMKKEFDVAYVYQTSPVTMAIPALVYKKLTGKKVLLYCLDIWPECIAAAGIGNKSIIYKILLLVSRKIYNSADKVQVTSSLFIDYFKKVIKLKDENKLEYLPQYAEDLYRVDQTNHNRNLNGEVNLVFAGNIGKMQSVETVILAAAELKNESNIKWHIVGDGSNREACEKLVADLGLEKQVIFYGQRPVEEMPAFFSMASALLVTLKQNDLMSYTMPGKVQSYMAAGKPIIGAINGETQKMIDDSKCGLCCNAEDFKGLARIVKQFAEEHDKQRYYEENSSNYYEQHFAKRITLQKMNFVLNELRG